MMSSVLDEPTVSPPEGLEGRGWSGLHVSDDAFQEMLMTGKKRGPFLQLPQNTSN